MKRRVLLLSLSFVLSACKPDTPPEVSIAAPARAPIPQDKAWAAAGVEIQFPAGNGTDAYFARLDIASCARRIDYALAKDPALAQRVSALPSSRRNCLIPALVQWCLQQYPQWFPSTQESAYFALAMDTAGNQTGSACAAAGPDNAMSLLASAIAMTMPRTIPAE